MGRKEKRGGGTPWRAHSTLPHEHTRASAWLGGYLTAWHDVAAVGLAMVGLAGRLTVASCPVHHRVKYPESTPVFVVDPVFICQ